MKEHVSSDVSLGDQGFAGKGVFGFICIVAINDRRKGHFWFHMYCCAKGSHERRTFAPQIATL